MIKGGQSKAQETLREQGPCGPWNIQENTWASVTTFKDLEASKQAQPHHPAGLLRLIQDPWDQSVCKQLCLQRRE